MKTDITIQTELTNGATQSFYLNLPKILSSYNRKGMNMVDGNGNAQLYTVSASLIGSNANATLSAAPNCYPTKRAVKDWHAAWVRRLRKAGIRRDDLGPYMKYLRMYLDRAHYVGAGGTAISGVTGVAELDTEEIDTSASAGSQGSQMFPKWAGEEWSYTEIVHTNPADGASNSLTAASRLVGEYSLTLCDQDAEDADASNRDLITGGMIYSWLGSFTQTPTPTEAETLIDPTNQKDNSLMSLRDSDLSSAELLDMAQEAVQEKAPWDRDGSSYYTPTVTGGVMAARSGSSNTIVAEAPCGLLLFKGTNDANGSEFCYLNLEVVGIEDM
jgi:hypothetical protein